VAVADVLETAREQVLEHGRGLGAEHVLAVLQLPDGRTAAALDLAHEVRTRWCGPEVEVEGIVSVKTGGCPEDCGYCPQAARYHTAVESEALLGLDEVLAAAKAAKAAGAEYVGFDDEASEFSSVFLYRIRLNQAAKQYLHKVVAEFRNP
jgi:biotin synthase